MKTYQECSWPEKVWRRRHTAAAPIKAARIWLMTVKMKDFGLNPWEIAWRMANDRAHHLMVYYKT